MDTAGIPLPVEGEPLIQEHLQRQQLEHLTEVVTQIMVHLRCQSTPTLPPSAPQPPAPPPSRPVAAIHASLPELYPGDPDKCCHFLLACDLYFAEFPDITVRRMISTVIQQLTRHAL